MAETDSDGKIPVKVWTPDEIATHLILSEVCDPCCLGILGLLLQGGAVVTLPDNYVPKDDS